MGDKARWDEVLRGDVRGRVPTPALAGGASIYYDHDHMSNQFSATLASALLRRLPKA